MTTAQRLAIRLSEIRQKLNGLSAIDEPTDEQRAELRKLTDLYPTREERHRGALVAESAEAEARGDDDPGDPGDGENRERAELRSRSRLGRFVEAAIAGRLIDGACMRSWKQRWAMRRAVPAGTYCRSGKGRTAAKMTRTRTPTYDGTSATFAALPSWSRQRPRAGAKVGPWQLRGQTGARKGWALRLVRPWSTCGANPRARSWPPAGAQRRYSRRGRRRGQARVLAPVPAWSLQALGDLLAGELPAKLEVPGLRIGFDRLFASDLQGRARAFQSLTGGGMEADRAATLAGLV